MTSLLITIDGQEFEVDLVLSALGGDTYTARVDGEDITVVNPRPEAAVADIEWLVVNGRPYEIVFDANLQWLRAWDGLHHIGVQDRNERVARPRSGDGRIKAPIPGLITRILVEPGVSVRAGQPLLVLEAMKMENEIRAPFDGVISSIQATPGETVVRNQLLAEVQ